MDCGKIEEQLYKAIDTKILYQKKYLTSRFSCGYGDFLLEEQKKKVLKRKLIAFELDEKGIPRTGYDIVDGQGKLIGKVTSGTMSPSLKKGIGLGYVSPVFSDFGSKINIQIRKNAVPATVVKLPFYKG